MLASCVDVSAGGRPAADGRGGGRAGDVAGTGSDAEEAARSAVESLRRGDFEEAEKEAEEALRGSADAPKLRLVRAITRYRRAANQLTLDARTVVIGGLGAGAINQKYLARALEDGESELALVEADLAVAAEDPGVAIELCVACWEIDWNGNGRFDRRDALLPQIEVDERGDELPEDDPRRKPTFRFDVGDVAWARAFVSFQRAAIDVVLAYDWGHVGTLMRIVDEESGVVTIKLVDPSKIATAKQRILEGLAFSDESRRLYLAETDDDREWVPNPRQKDHPMPLPMDQAVYGTWEEVVKDVRALVRGEEGLGVADVFKLAGESPGKKGAHGYIDIGLMLSHPKDIVLNLDALREADEKRDADRLMSATFGEYYKATMKPSPLPKTLLRMKGEIDTEEREFDRKLRYLLWIN